MTDSKEKALDFARDYGYEYMTQDVYDVTEKVIDIAISSERERTAKEIEKYNNLIKILNETITRLSKENKLLKEVKSE